MRPPAAWPGRSVAAAAPAAAARRPRRRRARALVPRVQRTASRRWGSSSGQGDTARPCKLNSNDVAAPRRRKKLIAARCRHWGGNGGERERAAVEEGEEVIRMYSL